MPLHDVRAMLAAAWAASLPMRPTWGGGRDVPPYAVLSTTTRRAFQARVEERLAVYAGRRVR